MLTRDQLYRHLDEAIRIVRPATSATQARDVIVGLLILKYANDVADDFGEDDGHLTQLDTPQGAI